MGNKSRDVHLNNYSNRHSEGEINFAPISTTCGSSSGQCLSTERHILESKRMQFGFPKSAEITLGENGGFPKSYGFL